MKNILVIASVLLFIVISAMPLSTSAKEHGMNEKYKQKNVASLPAVTKDTFKCMLDMTPVRGFYVDNLNPEKLPETVRAAKAEKTVYPAGSVVQLVPTEVMIKQVEGTNPSTNDWLFYELTVSDKGSEIRVQGYDNVKNRFGGNCLACHKKAKPEYDMICEQGHGCDPIAITSQMTSVLQKTDPRCAAPPVLSSDEQKLFEQMQAMFDL